MDKVRFSLLLLDPGEIYFQDASAVLITSDITSKTYEYKKQDGRLKLCSKSLVFDPKDVSKPLTKIPLKDCRIIEKWKGKSKFIESNNVLHIICERHIQMLAGNEIAPYKFCEDAKFLFSLNYANIDDILAQITQLQRANTLPAVEQNNMISAIVHSRHSRVNFDLLWLDLYEKILYETQGDKIAPLVVNPGRILLTNCGLYFQPYCNVETYPYIKINLSSIKRILKRRFLLKHIGLEIYSNDDKSSHIYIALANQEVRDTLHRHLLEQPELKLEEADKDVMTLQWQNGIVSNYDYLIYINSLGDRTVNDLTQYPVFPWVISNYTSERLDLEDETSYRDLSKPMGALNEARLNRLMERYEEMQQPKFIYGSHYSTPGFVLYYLVRQYPQYMLCLQNGRFDMPDRMFNSIADVYRNCLSNMSDFKELIPQFYDVESEGQFLVNSMGINFGYRENKVKVGDVELPPWAESPKHFVKTLRNALESEIVSNNLHMWIDLIFGYKQRGEEALKAKNVFNYMCYEGNVDLDSIIDINQRHPLEVQIMEFGQVPKQVFFVPHPQRKMGKILVEPFQLHSDDNIEHDLYESWRNIKSLKLQTSFQTHKAAISFLLITKDCDNIVSVGHDSKMKIFSISLNRQIRSAIIGSMPLSSCIELPSINTLIVGSWDNTIKLYDLDFGRITHCVQAHEDAITCMIWGEKCKYLFSGSSDCTVRMWKGFDANGDIKPIDCLLCQLDHNSEVSCLNMDSDNSHIVVGTEDGEIFIWNIKEKVLYKKFNVHKSTIRAISYSPDGLKLVSCSSDKTFNILDIETGMTLYSKLTDSQLCCLKWCDFMLLFGDEEGVLHVWDIVEVKFMYSKKLHSGSINVLDISSNKKYLVTGGQDNLIHVWVPVS